MGARVAEGADALIALEERSSDVSAARAQHVAVDALVATEGAPRGWDGPPAEPTPLESAPHLMGKSQKSKGEFRTTIHTHTHTHTSWLAPTHAARRKGRLQLCALGGMETSRANVIRTIQTQIVCSAEC